MRIGTGSFPASTSSSEPVESERSGSLQPLSPNVGGRKHRFEPSVGKRALNEVVYGRTNECLADFELTQGNVCLGAIHDAIVLAKAPPLFTETGVAQADCDIRWGTEVFTIKNGSAAIRTMCLLTTNRVAHNPLGRSSKRPVRSGTEKETDVVHYSLHCAHSWYPGVPWFTKYFGLDGSKLNFQMAWLISGRL